MAHFQLETELQSALRLDSSICVNTSRHGGAANRSSRQPAGSENSGTPCRSRARSAGRPANTSLLNGSLNSSKIFGLQQPSTANNGVERSLSSSRLSSPSRTGGGGSINSRTPSRDGGGDRFIPNRSTTDLEMAHHSLAASTDNTLGNTDNSTEDSLTDQQRRKQTMELLNANHSKDSRILSFNTKAPAPDEAHANSLKVLYSTGKPKAAAAAKTRQIPSKPERILDAPELVDDFYLHLLDWSVNNHIAVALYNSLFVWNAGDGSITEICSKGGEEDYVSCVKWIPEGNIVALGDSNGLVELWDVTSSKQLRAMRGHSDRISTLDWNAHILASGSRTGQVFLHDVRVAEHHVATLSCHTQEVCGMAWMPEGSRTLATGGNDNLVLIWDDRSPGAPVFNLTAHQAAVKAMAFCPWQPRTLATGGGTVDRTIKLWNVSSGNLLNSVGTGSQVSSIVWSSAEYKELISGHGFSHNQLTVWKYPAMTKVTDLQGHTSRVLELLKSPDGSTIASAAGDETIRLWKVWPLKDKKAEAGSKKSKQPVSLFTQQRIR